MKNITKVRWLTNDSEDTDKNCDQCLYTNSNLFSSFLTKSEVAFFIALADTDNKCVCAAEVRIAIVWDDDRQVVDFGKFTIKLSILDSDISCVIWKK